MTADDTPSRDELLDGLIQDALDVLHHDTTEGSDVDLYERKRLRQKFSARLAALPDDGVREATPAQHVGRPKRDEPATFVRNGKLETCRCFDCRALSTKAPKP